MVNEIPKMSPDYKRIYFDIVMKKYIHKIDVIDSFLNKNNITELDILEINRRIFGYTNIDKTIKDSKHRSYQLSSIVKILEFQKNNKLNNSELAIHFGISRNTIAKWKKYYLH